MSTIVWKVIPVPPEPSKPRGRPFAKGHDPRRYRRGAPRVADARATLLMLAAALESWAKTAPEGEEVRIPQYTFGQIREEVADAMRLLDGDPS